MRDDATTFKARQKSLTVASCRARIRTRILISECRNRVSRRTTTREFNFTAERDGLAVTAPRYRGIPGARIIRDRGFGGRGLGFIAFTPRAGSGLKHGATGP